MLIMQIHRLTTNALLATLFTIPLTSCYKSVDSSQSTSTDSVSPTVKLDPPKVSLELPIPLNISIDTNGRISFVIRSNVKVPTPLGTVKFSLGGASLSDEDIGGMEKKYEGKRILVVKIDEEAKIYEIEKRKKFKIKIESNDKLYKTITVENKPNDKDETLIVEIKSVPSNKRNSFEQNSSGKISQSEAMQVVQKWLDAKKQMFGPPYDQELGRSLATGKALADNIQGPSTDGTAESSLEWLKNRGKLWKYGLPEVKSVKSFVADKNRAVITVSVFEDRALYNRGGSVEQHIAKTITTTYTLERSNGRLKIADFRQ
jgi:ARC6-like, IMS domain